MGRSQAELVGQIESRAVNKRFAFFAALQEALFVEIRDEILDKGTDPLLGGEAHGFEANGPVLPLLSREHQKKIKILQNSTLAAF